MQIMAIQHALPAEDTLQAPPRHPDDSVSGSHLAVQQLDLLALL